jgi:hypothetical protein
MSTPASNVITSELSPVHHGDRFAAKGQSASSHMPLELDLLGEGSTCAFIYLQPSLIRSPKLPHYFRDIPDGSPSGTTTGQLTTSDQVLDLFCNISELLYDVVSYCANPPHQLGSQKDITARRDMYASLWVWNLNFPRKTSFPDKRLSQYYFLRCASESPIHCWLAFLTMRFKGLPPFRSCRTVPAADPVRRPAAEL